MDTAQIRKFARLRPNRRMIMVKSLSKPGKKSTAKANHNRKAAGKLARSAKRTLGKAQAAKKPAVKKPAARKPKAKVVARHPAKKPLLKRATTAAKGKAAKPVAKKLPQPIAKGASKATRANAKTHAIATKANNAAAVVKPSAGEIAARLSAKRTER